MSLHDIACHLFTSKFNNFSTTTVITIVFIMSNNANKLILNFVQSIISMVTKELDIEIIKRGLNENVS